MRREIPPVLIQGLGLGIIVASTVFYFLNNEASLTIMSIGLALATTGTIQRAVTAFSQNIPIEEPEQLPPTKPGASR